MRRPYATRPGCLLIQAASYAVLVLKLVLLLKAS